MLQTRSALAPLLLVAALTVPASGTPAGPGTDSSQALSGSTAPSGSTGPSGSSAPAGSTSRDPRLPQAPDVALPALNPGAALPTAAGLAAVLAGPLHGSAIGPSVSVAVADAATGTVLLAQGAGRAAVPASTVKILTGIAVLDALGPDATLSTTAVAGRTPTEVVLVGGGDVLLAAGAGNPKLVNGHAGLGDLAALVAGSLPTGKPVSVLVDDSAFTGPGRSPGWPAGDITGGYVAPIAALAVDAGNATPGHRSKPGEPFARAADPALAAGTAFAVALRGRGLTVTGVKRGRAPAASPRLLGTINSAPIAEVLGEALAESDNTVAEALARLVAVHDRAPATFAGAGQAVLARLKTLGLPTTGARLAGGSGLGSGYATSADLLARALVLAASPAHPQLRAVLTGLPVAGASGTLAERFAAPAAASARGLVRAKTGTLTGSSSLAGTVVDGDGRLLVFAVLADRVPATKPARAALDVAAAALAGCGCH